MTYFYFYLAANTLHHKMKMTVITIKFLQLP